MLHIKRLDPTVRIAAGDIQQGRFFKLAGVLHSCIGHHPDRVSIKAVEYTAGSEPAKTKIVWVDETMQVEPVRTVAITYEG